MKRTSHTILLVIAMAVTVVVALVYAYMLHSTELSVNKSEAAKAAVLAAQSSNSREQSFMQIYQSTQNDWARLPTFFIPSSSIVTFIESIESLGPAANATTSIASIDADNLDGAPEGKLGKIHAHVVASGSWTGMVRTLELSELMPYKISVGNVHMSTSGVADKSGKKSWQMSYDIVATMIATGTSSPTQ